MTPSGPRIECRVEVWHKAIYCPIRPLRRARGRRIQLAGNPAGAGGQPAGLDRQPHGVGHAQRVGRAGDSRVQQHAVAAQLHGDRHVAGRSDPRVDDHRISRVILLQVLEDDPDIVGVEHALSADPIGLPAGITLAAPASLSRRAITGSSLV